MNKLSLRIHAPLPIRISGGVALTSHTCRALLPYIGQSVGNARQDVAMHAAVFTNKSDIDIAL